MGVRKERPGKRAFFLFLLILLEATLHGETRQEDVSTSFDLLEPEYVVTVNLSLQEVTVFRGGRTVRSMVCSSGIPTGDNGTPTGRYIIDESGKKRGGRVQLYEVREESLTDGELGELCAHDDSFLGAILWVIGHL